MPPTQDPQLLALQDKCHRQLKDNKDMPKQGRANLDAGVAELKRAAAKRDVLLVLGLYTSSSHSLSINIFIVCGFWNFLIAVKR